MIKLKTPITIKYRLHESSAPYMALKIISLDPRVFDYFTQSKTAFDIGGWIIYYVDLDRIKLQHSVHELYEAVYLRADIN